MTSRTDFTSKEFCMVRLKAYDSCALKKIGLQAALGPLVLSVQKPVLETGLIDSIRTWTKWKDEASTPWPHNINFLSSGNRPPAPAPGTSNRHRAPAPGIRHPASGTGIRHRPPAPGTRHPAHRHPAPGDQTYLLVTQKHTPAESLLATQCSDE